MVMLSCEWPKAKETNRNTCHSDPFDDAQGKLREESLP